MLEVALDQLSSLLRKMTEFGGYSHQEQLSLAEVRHRFPEMSLEIDKIEATIVVQKMRPRTATRTISIPGRMTCPSENAGRTHDDASRGAPPGDDGRPAPERVSDHFGQFFSVLRLSMSN